MPNIGDPSKLIHVYRTTDREGQPCEEAKEYLVPIQDVRDTDDPRKVEPDWYTKGTNHKTIRGCSYRELEPEVRWFLDPDTDLWEFVKKYDECVLKLDCLGNRIIEIYDDWRE